MASLALLVAVLVSALVLAPPDSRATAPPAPDLDAPPAPKPSYAEPTNDEPTNDEPTNDADPGESPAANAVPCDEIPESEWRRMTPEDFKAQRLDGEALSRPAVFRGAALDWPREEWTLDAMRRRWRDVDFRYGGSPPYPEQTRPLRNMSFAEPGGAQLFQFGQVPASFAMQMAGACVPAFGMRYSYAAPLHADPEVACSLVAPMRVPPFLGSAVTVQLAGIIVGGPGAVTVRHAHDAAVNALLWGEKRWVLGKRSEFACEQREGDVVFVPEHMSHVVRNRRFSVGVQLQFHANHFGTTVGHAELSRHIEASLRDRVRSVMERRPPPAP